MLASRPAKPASGRAGLLIEGTPMTRRRLVTRRETGEVVAYRAIARSTASASSGERARLGRPRSSSFT